MPQWTGISNGPLGGGGNDSWPIWTGVADPGTDVKVTIDGEEYAVRPDENGVWDFTPPKPLSQGDHEIKMEARDPWSGELAEGEEFELNVDADREARANDKTRHEQWEQEGRDQFHQGHADALTPTPTTPAGGGGGGGSGEQLTTGGTGAGPGTGTGTGSGSGSGGQPQPEKGNAPRG